MKELSIPKGWEEILQVETRKKYFQTLGLFLEKEYQEKSIFPACPMIFKALELTSYEATRVVILGQDPYHGVGQAQGMSFSVPSGVKLPPSLRNIFKELQADLGGDLRTNGDLTDWATQGVLLLNTVLTVQSGQAHSHKDKGWEQFTDSIITQLNQKEESVVFILWGQPAQTKISKINQEKHKIITAPHPSPLSAYRGFFGSKPFSKTNQALKNNQQKEINWLE